MATIWKETDPQEDFNIAKQLLELIQNEMGMKTQKRRVDGRYFIGSDTHILSHGTEYECLIP